MSQRPINEEELHALVDEVLEPERRADVLRYLQVHPDVAERVDSYRRQRDALRARLAAIAEAPLPPELNIRNIAQRRGRLHAFRWPTALAASVLLSLGMAGGWLLHETVRPVDTGLTALADEAESGFRVYATDMERPVELRAVDHSQLTRWMSSRLNHAVSAPDLSASGYRFMGGRLLATPHGPAALFMYDDDRGTRLVMVSRPMAHERNSRMRSISYDASSSIVWSDRGIGYGLVGRLEPHRLRQLADEAKRQLTGLGKESGPA